MAFEPAPFHGAESEGPGGGSAFWTRAEDGVRIRVGGWRAGERGTVVVFNGRNEFIEKYGRLATDFAGSGYAAASCDWRSQGLADRLSDTPMLGHIERFTDFQKDAAAFLDWLEAQGYPKPWHLVAHSMGGLIALRHVHGPHPFATITFSSPMWGIGFPLPLRIAAPAIAHLGMRLGYATFFAPGTGPDSYTGTTAFEDNVLTGDADTYEWLKRLEAKDDLEVGGPSFQWVHEALRECRLQRNAPAPDVPTLIALGDEEQVVDPRAIHAMARRWNKATFLPLSPSKHEPLMERPGPRGAFLAAMLEQFAKAEAQVIAAVAPATLP